MSTCQTCGKDFTGGYVKHAIKDHPRGSKTTQAQVTPTGTTGGDLEMTWGAAGTPEQDLASVREAHVRRSPVRTAAKAQVTTPKPSAKSARMDARNAIPARERALRAELRQARRAMRRIERELVDVRA